METVAIYRSGTGMGSFEWLPEHLRHNLPKGTTEVQRTKDGMYVAFSNDGRMRFLPRNRTGTMPSFNNTSENFDVERNRIPEFILKLLPSVRFNVMITKANGDCGNHCKEPGSQSCGTFNVEYNEGNWGRKITITVKCGVLIDKLP